MWLLSKARHTRREDKALAAKAVPFALTARGLIGRRKGEEDKFYSWSLSNIDVAGDVEQELFLCYADLNDAPMLLSPSARLAISGPRRSARKISR